jgi:hypothetical protein
LNGWELSKPADVDAGRRREAQDRSGEHAEPAGDLFDGASVRHLALAFAELATIVLHGAGQRFGAEIWLCAGDGRGGSDTVSCADERPHGNMVIEIGKDRRVIVDAGFDATALARDARHSGAPMIPVAAGARIWAVVVLTLLNSTSSAWPGKFDSTALSETKV